MSIEHRPISPLRQRMIEDMRLRKLSEKTQSGYIRWVKKFAGSSSDVPRIRPARRTCAAFSCTYPTAVPPEPA
jgi:hypothetical protein